MCGVNGIFSSDSYQNHLHDIEIMNRALKHRGPDGQGVWNNSQNIIFGHTRLAIVDLSSSGHQPMTSSTGRYTITFNGEIYNFRLLKKELEKKGKLFRGNSDTEVLLALFEEFGIEQALTHLHGMFAFVVWDDLSKKLYLVRDRLGEKPLYYAFVDNTFLFSSEIKSFLRIKKYKFTLDHESLAYYFKYNYVPTPRSIFKEIKKLQAGSFICGQKPEQIFSCPPQSYWQLPPMQQNLNTRSDESLVTELDEKLKSVITNSLLADVPVGVFLSGGIDSSLIASIAQNISKVKVNTFTIGFEEPEFDESTRAQNIAQQLGTDHTTWRINSADVKNIIPDVPRIYDEPFSDSSQLPTTLLAKLTRQKVTVALSGDGGDELFAGYNRYPWLRKINNNYLKLPVIIRKTTNQIMTKSPELILQKIISNLFNEDTVHFNHKLTKLKSILASNSPGNLFDRTISHQFEINKILNQSYNPVLSPEIFKNEDDYISQMMTHDLLHYLADDILVKVDRATMFASLESRAPFLDHDIVGFCRTINTDTHLKNGQKKWLLKKLLKKYLPDVNFDHPKQGFSAPLEHWFRNDLKTWMLDMTSESELKKHNLINFKYIEKMRDEHLSKKHDWQFQLWDVLVFQSWYNQWMSN